MSTRTRPSPAHSSHRPPGMLNEKWAAPKPAWRASSVFAKSSRIASNAFM